MGRINSVLAASTHCARETGPQPCRAGRSPALWGSSGASHPPASRRKLHADCHSYNVRTKAAGRSLELCAGVTSSSLCRAPSTAGNFQHFHLRLQYRCYYGWQYPYLETLPRPLLFQRLLSLRMNSSLSKLAPNLSHDNIFTAKPIWSLSQNQIRFRLKPQIWRITLCQQGRGKRVLL